jgi:hypothetical protein
MDYATSNQGCRGYRETIADKEKAKESIALEPSAIWFGEVLSKQL